MRTRIYKILLYIFVAHFLVACDPPAQDENASQSVFTGAKKAEALSSSSIRISWDLLVSSEVNGYQVFEMAEDSSLKSLGLVGVNESFFIQTALKPLTKYRFVVRAIFDESKKDENNYFVEATTLAPGDLNVVPSDLNTSTLKTHIFKVNDGKAPYKFTKISGGGVLNTITGEFVSPSTPGISIIKVEDSAGSFAYVQIKVFYPLRLEPANSQLMTGRQLQFLTTGGQGPYNLELVSGAASATLDTSTAKLTAGAITGNVVVKVTDANNLQETALITVVDKYTPEYQLTSASQTMCISEKNKDIMKCWGSSLGINIAENMNIGDQPGEMGDNLLKLEIGTQTGFKKIDTSVASTCVITSDDHLKCIGSNGDDGRLGNGNDGISHNTLSSANGLTPSLDFGLGRTVKDVSLNYDSGCVILDNDLVKCWGDGEFGQLGSGSVADLGDGSGEMGDSLAYVDLGTGRSAKAIASSVESYCAILDNDLIKCWGRGQYGALGNGSEDNFGDSPGEMGDALPYVDLGTGRTAKKIIGGYYGFCSILDNDQLKCWGRNNSGQLGLGDTNYRGNQAGEMGDALPYVNVGTGRTVVDVAMSNDATCAILDDNGLKCWGNLSYTGQGTTKIVGNQAGQMGDTLNYVDLGSGYYAKAVSSGFGANHFCFLLNTNEVKCVGNNGNGQLGLEHNIFFGRIASETADRLDPINLGSGLLGQQIAVSHSFTCVLLNDSSAKCFGDNRFASLSISKGQVGDQAGEMGSNTPSFSVGKPIQEALSTPSSPMVITTEGKLRNWGYASHGRLGLQNGDIGNALGEMGSNLADVDFGTGRTVKMAAATDASKCVILDNDLLKCYGDSNYGMTGNETTIDIGDGVGEMGDALAYVNLGSGRTVQKIVSGSAHFCAQLDNNKVKCWGAGSLGRLGYGDSNNRGDDPGEMGDNLPYVDLGTGRTVRDLFAGNRSQTTCALMDNYELKCWGRNDRAQLGLGDYNHRGDNPGEMGDNLPSVSMGVSEKIVDMAIGSYAVCVQYASERVRCWGDGNSGQLAIGYNPGHLGNSPGEVEAKAEFINFGTNRRVRTLATSGDSFCAVLDNTKVKCWGNNGLGTLGYGHAIDWGNAPEHIGDSWPYVDFGGL